MIIKFGIFVLGLVIGAVGMLFIRKNNADKIDKIVDEIDDLIDEKVDPIIEDIKDKVDEKTK